MGRIIAIDYGTRRTGIAVSDPLQLIAGGLATVETRELERYLTQYIAREDVSVIVVGKPLKMNGAPSETMRFVLPLVARLHRTYPSIEVVLYDERFTSAIAHRAMLDGGLRKMARRNRALVDGSDYCVAYLTKNSGGTLYTCSYALKKGVELINLADGLPE